MTNVPASIIQRRAELEREAANYRNTIQSVMQDQLVVMAALREIGFAIAAIEDADCAASGEAGAQGSASGATSGAPGAESAPAGEFEPLPYGAVRVGRSVVITNRVDLPEAVSKKPRAPKRPIRAMVLAHMEQWQSPKTAAQLATALGVTLRAVESAVAYWQAKGRLTLDGGVVMVRTERFAPDVVPIEAMHAAFAEVEQAALVVPPGVEIVGDALTSRGELLEFLTRNPDSTMDEIREQGIEASDVYLAEHQGIVFSKAHGLWALVEAEGETRDAAE